jgi:CHAT domain-containing protein
MSLRLCSSPDTSFRQFAFLDDPRLQPGSSGQGRLNRQQLFGSLFPEEVCERLHPDHTLIIVPTHQLYGLPFQALIDGDTPLIEMTQVLYTQSLSTLLETMKRTPARVDDGQPGLILAQSEFTTGGYPALLHIEYEVDAINRRNPAISRYPDGELSRQLLRQAGQTGPLSQAKLLHIATHAHYDAETGAYTGLLLGEDILDIEDIYDWKLQAQLVTLSACQTGMGRWYYGDEIVGITQAFLSAGARSVIASLWQVADEHAADLMAELYTQLENCGEPTKALAEAQRRANQAGMQTYYWAPFSVFGQP